MMNNLVKMLDDLDEKETMDLLANINVPIEKHRCQRIETLVLKKAGLLKTSPEKPLIKKMRLVLITAAIIVFGTAGGYYAGIADILKGIFLNNHNLSSDQLFYLEEMGYILDGTPVLADSYQLQPIAAMSDYHSIYVIFDLQNEDKTPITEEDELYFHGVSVMVDSKNTEIIPSMQRLQRISSINDSSARFVLWLYDFDTEDNLLGEMLRINLSRLYRMDDVYGQIPLAYGPWELTVPIEHQNEELTLDYQGNWEIQRENSIIIIQQVIISPISYWIKGIEIPDEIDEFSQFYGLPFDLTLLSEDKSLIALMENQRFGSTWSHEEKEIVKLDFNGHLDEPINPRGIRYLLIDGVEIELIN